MTQELPSHLRWLAFDLDNTLHYFKHQAHWDASSECSPANLRPTAERSPDENSPSGPFGQFFEGITGFGHAAIARLLTDQREWAHERKGHSA